jgi:transposase
MGLRQQDVGPVQVVDGIAIPVGIAHIAKDVLKIIEDDGYDLPGSFQQLIGRLVAHFKELDKQVDELEGQIKQWHRENEDSRRLAEIPGIGPMTASALAASVGDAKSFKNGRQLAAWLGLVPRQHSTGGKSTLLGISKRGDTYPNRSISTGDYSRCRRQAEPANRMPNMNHAFTSSITPYPKKMVTVQPLRN